jgi:uncharacterized protein
MSRARFGTARISLIAAAMLCVGAAGCRPNERDNMSEKSGSATSPDLNFKCVHESDRVPAVTPEADAVFQRARVMERAAGAKDFDAIAKLYAQAGEMGHWKALQNLQVLYYQGLADHPKPAQHVIDINERLIKLGAPIGYYNMATYLEQGYGVKQDKTAALNYYRKSADMGSPQGQLHVGKLLTWEAKQFDVGVPMLECAMAQGNGRAARELSGYYRAAQNDLQKALSFAQRGAALGNPESASVLFDCFDKGASALTDYRTGVDKARAARYLSIIKELERNTSARFPDIDKIVPLPPAPLPAWDGTFEYKKAT